MAQFTTKSNFSHQVADEKEVGHVLITTGIYSILRHPSYTGFYWWAVGTQLVLGNPICFILYLLALNQFFRDRIEYEEVTLVKFFGPSYLSYRKTSFIGIPFL